MLRDSVRATGSRTCSLQLRSGQVVGARAISSTSGSRLVAGRHGDRIGGQDRTRLIRSAAQARRRIAIIDTLDDRYLRHSRPRASSHAPRCATPRRSRKHDGSIPRQDPIDQLLHRRHEAVRIERVLLEVDTPHGPANIRFSSIVAAMRDVLQRLLDAEAARIGEAPGRVGRRVSAQRRESALATGSPCSRPGPCGSSPVSSGVTNTSVLSGVLSASVIALRRTIRARAAGRRASPRSSCPSRRRRAGRCGRPPACVE